ncbi:MAG TPA: Ppx/GppA family phosphatase [Streptosporangiaceae bacterium]|nr:Ppx/GppA family phosphatase [Streptosporangiaceae bacterium]
MRIAILDVGSNSAHLKIAELLTGEPPLPVRTVKRATRLAESIDRHGAINIEAVDRLAEAVAEAVATADAHRVDKLIAFATSAVRDAANREEVISRVRAASGMELGFISGEDEARLTFLAARRWAGWSAGQLLLLDIGGGSLEVAAGDGSEPRVALSVPLGAGRLTRDYLPGSPPRGEHVRRLRRHVRDVLRDVVRELDDQPSPVRAVATSKIFTQLARLTGAPKAKAGIYAERRLRRKRLEKWIPRLASMNDAKRAKQRGVSKTRARQILAGAIVATDAMHALGLQHVDICPWALREGILQCELDALGGPSLRSGITIYAGDSRPNPPRLRTVANAGA